MVIDAFELFWTYVGRKHALVVNVVTKAIIYLLKAYI